MPKSPEKQKVLYLITKSNWGGAQRYVYDLATNLDRARFEPVVALGGSGTLRDLLHHADIRTISIDSLERDIAVRKEWRTIRTIWHILKTEQPDILHLNSSKAGGLGAFLGRVRRVPLVIFTAHGWFFNEDRPWWQRFSSKFLHWLTVLFAHRTIAVSSAIVEQMNWPGARRKMKIINPGRTIGVMFDRTSARTALAEYTPELSAANSRKYTWIGTVAELHPVKQLDILINSLLHVSSDTRPLRCLIIGEGNERQALEACIRAHGLESQVFLLGHVPDAARFLHALDIFVLPSRSEAYGYAVHEAGLARLPVVASDVGGIRDIITHKQTGLLVPSGDATALALALQQIITDRTLAEELRSTLKQTLNTRSVARMVDATTALYTIR